MATTNVSIRMDSDLQAQADALFAELGMNLSTAFNIFVRQSLREGGIPFEIRTERPNKETVAAMLLAIKGDFPKEKEPLVYGHCRFLVLEVVDHRIVSVRVKVMPEY